MKRTLLLCALVFTISSSVATAAVVITPTSGGSAISADTTGGAYTTLTGPTIREGAFRDFPASGSFILNAPSGFSFNTAAAVTATITRTASTGNCFTFSSTTATPTASTITFTLTRRDGNPNTTRCQVAFSNIQVRPTAGTPLASARMTKTGTASVAGITNNVTSLGTSTEIAGAKNQLTFTVQPSTTATTSIDFTIKPVIHVDDKFGNTISSDSASTITLTPKLSGQSCTGSNGGGVLSSTPASGATVTSGVMTYTAMQYSAAEDIAICAASTGATSTLSTAISVRSPIIVPTKFVILPPGNGTVDAPVTVTIEAQDNAGNVATTYQQDVTLLKSGSATGGGLINIVNGVGATTIADVVMETVHLTLSDTQGTGLNVTSAQDVIFAAGATKQLFLTDPGSMTAGNRYGFTVTRKDQYGNLKTSGSETYYPYTYSTGTAARFYDAAVAGNIITSLTVPNGTSSASFWYYDELAGAHAIAISDTTPPDGATGIIDATSTATVTAAAATQFNITQNSTMTAGTRLAYTVTRADQFGNLSSAGSNIVYLTSNSAGAAKKFYDAATAGNIITSVTLDSGVTSGNFWYYDELATNATVYASDNAAGPDGNAGIIDGTNAITILPAATHAYLLDNATGTMQVGTRFQYAVSRFDAFNNAVTSGSNTVYLQSNSTGAKTFYNAASGGSVITSVAIGAGSPNATFWYYDDAAGTWTITGYDNSAGPDGATGIVDATSSITVSPAPIVATRFTIVKPADDVVGATVPVTIRAEDNSGQLDTTYNNSVTLVTSGHATPQNGVVVTVTNGLGSVNITDTFAETVTLSLIDSATTSLNISSTQTVTFSTGPTAQYILSNPGDMTAGTRLGYTVTRKDAFGNLVTSGLETVHFSSNATGGLSAFYDASSGGNLITSVSIASSTSVANIWYYEGKSGAWTITATNDGGTISGARAVTVSPAATSQFSLNHPGDMTAGTRLGYTVTRQDQFGNLATTGSNTVYLYANPVSGTSAFFSAATGGSVITSRTISAGVSTASLWYYNESVGSETVTASDNASAPDSAGITDASDSFTITAAAIVATRLTIVKPADAQTGTNTTVTIRAEDNSGNVDTTFHSSVTLVTSGSATGGGVVNFTNGVGTKTITDAVAETVTLTLLDTASTSLDVSSSQTVTFSTTPPAPVSAAAVGGTTSVTRSTVIFAGKVFPGAKLTVVAVGDGDIPVRQGTVAGGDGSFSIRFNGMAAGLRSFFLSVTDQNGKSSQTKTYSVDVNQSLVVRDVLLPPTINFARQTVTKGGFVGITGYATPGFAVQATIDGVDTGAIGIADSSGKYSIPVNTFNLSLGAHTARTHQTSTEGVTSDASIEGTFMVSTLFDSQTDLNHDGKVDSTDLSIFLSRWHSPDPATRTTVDFNSDEKLDVQDLSIFSRTLNK